MRAVVVRTFGGPEALEVAEVPTPVPGPGQVRIRVRAAAVNPVDAFVRSGMATQVGMQPERDGDVGVGWDVAGVVDALGEHTAGFSVGDEVIGLSDRLDVPTGGYAEYLVLDAGAVARAPRGVSPELAATLPLNALTAAQALDRAELDAGRTLLVTGAAGAVGGYAVQLAASDGIRVLATASAADEKLVRSLGAAEFVPRGEHLATAVRALVPSGVDAVIDAAALGTRALDAVRGGGTFVAVLDVAVPKPLRGTRVRTVYVQADGRRLADLVARTETGRLTPRVAETYPLDKASEAHHRLAQGGLRGRLVLVP
ncbi:NADP-dependent oxidoreductase [Pseudonocardia acaciae]|uniref:NADP-dependent oxidoreductase n=1 Tax=Pseudonocardia acaciae TaxID=551276 RepID=UPI00048DEAD4|nr:NADP-dependent oxidoreductase [Pseudonocardia acaciae]